MFALYSQSKIYTHIMKRTFLSASLLMAIGVSAGGFQLNVQGVRAIGMGGAYTGLAHGPATAYFNPAGLTSIKGHQVNFGVNFISPSISLQTESTDNINQTTGMATPLHLYYGGQIGEKLFIGMAINNQFGSKSSFKDDWEGKYIVQNIGLTTFMFQPTVAYKVMDKLSIGAGLVYTTGAFSYEKAVPLTSSTYPYGKAHLEGKGTSFSYNIGIHSQILDNDKMSLSLGVDYRSAIDLQLKNGTATFTNIPPSLQDKFPAKTGFTGGLTLPSVTTAGLAFKYKFADSSSLTFVYDFVSTGWSSYDTLSFDFENEQTPDSKTVKNWQNVTAHRFGFEYHRGKLYYRVGGAYDQSPIPDGYVSPELPDATHFEPTAGLGMDVTEKIHVDVSYLSQNYSRTASLIDAGFSAKYNRRVSVFSIGASIKF